MTIDAALVESITNSITSIPGLLLMGSVIHCNLFSSPPRRPQWVSQFVENTQASSSSETDSVLYSGSSAAQQRFLNGEDLPTSNSVRYLECFFRAPSERAKHTRTTTMWLCCV